MNKLLFLLAIMLLRSTLNAQDLKESYPPEKPFVEQTDTVITTVKITWRFPSTPNSYVTQHDQAGHQLFKYCSAFPLAVW